MDLIIGRWIPMYVFENFQYFSKIQIAGFYVIPGARNGVKMDT
jgi:hypothetical protein